MEERLNNCLERLKHALDGWNQHRTELCRVAIRRDGDWRRQIVHYRRLSHRDIANIASLIGRLSANAGMTADLRALQNALSAMRSCAAEHQASWPAIEIIPGNPRYEQSLVWLRTAGDRFAATAAALLARLAQAA